MRACGRADPEDDPLQYLDYAGWEAEQLEDDTADARVARSYWADVPGSADFPSAPVRPLVAVPIALSTSLSTSPSTEQWLAVWAEVLLRHAGPDAASTDIAVAVDGRVEDDLRTAIGAYERYVPVTIRRDPTVSFPEFVNQV